MLLALVMICAYMVNNCCFRDLLMSKVSPGQRTDTERSDPTKYAPD